MSQKRLWRFVFSLTCLAWAASPAWGQDCNSNGVPDAQDIADGTSLDCDSNGVPDECQPLTPFEFRFLTDSLNPPAASSVITVRIITAALNLESYTPVLAKIGEVIYDADATPQPPTAVMHSIDTHRMNGVGPFTTAVNNQDFQIVRTISSYALTFLDGTLIELRFPGCDYMVQMTPQSGFGFGSPPGDGEDPPRITVDLMAEFRLFIDCPADVNGNRIVNVNDLLTLLADWGSCAAPCPSDIDDNGSVEVIDLLALLAAWGVCP